jgi:hypothetical protein
VAARADAALDNWVGERDYEELSKLLKDPSGIPALQPQLRRFSKLTLSEIKITGSDRASLDTSQARLKLRVELGGAGADGARLSMLAPGEAVFRRSQTGWRMTEFRSGPWRENRSVKPWFSEITEAAFGGIPSFRNQLKPGIDHWRAVMDEATGIDVYGHNGLAVGDYDGDGIEDLYICQPAGLPNRLYRNNGDGTFSDVTAAAGVAVMDASSMALFADVENDGDQDIIVVTSSQPLLFRNDGKGRFHNDKTSGLNITTARNATLTSAAMADYDRDGFLDIYVCAYDFYAPGSPYDAPSPYHDANNGPPNYLFRNRGDGTFEDVTPASGLHANNNRFSFAAAWGDYDNNGTPDLFVANDFGRKNLYRNNGDGTFTDVSPEFGVEDPGAGMSAAWGDFDNDGDLDLYAGNMWSSAGQRVTSNPAFARVAEAAEVRSAYQRHARGNSLFRNDRGKFTDVTLEAGVEMGRWSWSSDFADFDNDGREDLFIQNGYVTGPDTHDL